jgi:hypothetical protein
VAGAQVDDVKGAHEKLLAKVRTVLGLTPGPQQVGTESHMKAASGTLHHRALVTLCESQAPPGSVPTFAATLRDDGEPVRPITAPIAPPTAAQNVTAEVPPQQTGTTEEPFAVRDAGIGRLHPSDCEPH